MTAETKNKLAVQIRPMTMADIETIAQLEKQLFPDPWPKRRHHRRRLFSESFLDSLHRTMVDGGRLHFATDHLPYFGVVHEILGKDQRFREITAFVPDSLEL